MAECAINRWGRGQFKGFSAGSHPKGVVHPAALALLAKLGYETAALRSKSWDEFAGPGAVHFDFIFTVCDHAAAEQCPVWPGRPVSAHWGVPDPAAFQGPEDEERRCFAHTYYELEARIKAFVELDIERTAPNSLRKEIERIGSMKLDEADGQ